MIYVILKRQHIPDGSVCKTCGGLMIRTGSCMTCTHCGDTTGCGRTR